MTEDGPEPEDDKRRPKTPPLTYGEVTYVVEVLKGGVSFERLLSAFERQFIDEIAMSYSKYGEKFRVSGKQWTVLADVNRKLRLGLTDPAPH